MIQTRTGLILFTILTMAIFHASFRQSYSANAPVPSVHLESKFNGPPTVFSARNCLITEVQTSKDVVFIVFTDRWDHSPDLNLHASDGDRNGISISIKPDREGTRALLAKIRSDAKSLLGKRANIFITIKGPWLSLGGVPCVFLPSSEVKVTPVANK
jgi:hypothetical protein